MDTHYKYELDKSKIEIHNLWCTIKMMKGEISDLKKKLNTILPQVEYDADDEMYDEDVIQKYLDVKKMTESDKTFDIHGDNYFYKSIDRTTTL